MPSVPVPWEGGCGPADPALSRHFGSYTGSGYGTRGGTGEVGTINAGLNTPVTPGPPPALVRIYIQGNNLVILDNNTGNAYAVPLAVALAAQPAIYSPTK
jgi:hypothetical protein